MNEMQNEKYHELDKKVAVASAITKNNAEYLFDMKRTVDESSKKIADVDSRSRSNTHRLDKSEKVQEEILHKVVKIDKVTNSKWTRYFAPLINAVAMGVIVLFKSLKYF